MAFYCIDYNNGSNTTGDGSALAPWATIAYAETQINGGAGYVTGDEMRIAGSDISASIGTCQYASFVNNQHIVVNTAADYTSSISVGDLIQIGTSADAGALDVPLEVKAITATQITLYLATADVLYENTDYNIYKITDWVDAPIDSYYGYLDQINIANQSITPYSDSVTISGGWDPANFTSKTGYGVTSFKRTGTYQATVAYPYGGVFQYPTSNGTNGMLIKDFTVSRTHIIQYTSSNNKMGNNYDNIRAHDQAELIGSSFSGVRSISNCQGFGDPNYIFVASNSSINTNVVDNCKTIIGRTAQFPVIVGQQYGPGSTVTNLDLTLLPNSVIYLYRYDRVDFEFSTLTINTDPARTASNTFAYVLGSNAEYPQLNIPDNILSQFDRMTTSSAYQYNMTISSLANLPTFSNTEMFMAGGVPNTITTTGNGVTYQHTSVDGFTTINTVDNATGTNCLEYHSGTGRIRASILQVEAIAGSTLEVQVSAKINGATSSVTPTLKAGIPLANSYYGQMRALVSSTSTLTKTAGTSYDNSGYTTLTWSGTLPTYSSYTDSGSIYTVFLDFNLPAGESFLVDSITYTIS